jgi:hypothetical protein
MGKFVIGILMILAPGVGLALAKFIIDTLFRSQNTTLEEIITFFIYGSIAGVILLVLRLLVKGDVFG